MRRYIFLSFFVSFFCSSILAQSNFEAGYLIFNNGKKVDCLIDNRDWKNNPEKFNYKISESSKTEESGLDSILEFGITNKAKYIKATVGVDMSSDVMIKLSYERKPEFISQTIFLKVLLEGEAVLYKYEHRDLRRFFYKTNSQSIQQLVYKKYKLTAVSYDENKMYQQQLKVNLVCEEGKNIDPTKILYNEKSLLNAFRGFNACSSEEVTDYQILEQRNVFDLNIRPGLTVSSLSLNSLIYDELSTDFNQKIGSRIGLEVEVFLPFANGKIAILVEPTYTSAYNISTTVADGNRPITASINYKSLHFPAGVRYYHPLGKKSSLFFNALYSYELIDMSFNSSIKFSNRSTTISYSPPGLDLETNSNAGFLFGIGYKLKSKYSVEFRYYMPQEILGGIGTINETFLTEYESFHIVLGYRLF